MSASSDLHPVNVSITAGRVRRLRAPAVILSMLGIAVVVPAMRPEDPIDPAATPAPLSSNLRQVEADASWWQAVRRDLADREHAATVLPASLQAPNRAQNFRTTFDERGFEVVPHTEKTREVPSGEAQEGLPAGVEEGWSSAVQRDIAESEYDVTWQDCTLLPGVAGAYHAPNRAQNFRTYFTGDGIRVLPRTTHRDDAPAWEWGLSLIGWRRDGATTKIPPAPPAQVRVEGHRIEYDRGDVVEWYVNDARGLEQGFTIARRPGGPAAWPPRGESAAWPPSWATLSRGRPDGPVPLRLETAIAGTVRPVFDSDRDGVDFLTPAGACVIRFDHLVVADARGREVPAWFEMGEDAGSATLALVIDDRDAEYPIAIDPLATNPSWTAESDQGGAQLGTSVATAGDVNGDGFSDVIVGAFAFDNGETDEGRVFVYHGSAGGLSLVPNWTAESDQANAEFGYSVATAGDVNGDRFSDVIVGARHFDNGQTNEGRAFVYHGSAGGLSLVPNWTAESDQAFARFGFSVATAGDVDDDGFSDVIVGARLFDNGQTDEGGAFVYHGSAGGLSLVPNWTAESDQASAEFGFSVATAGDVNGDGFSDVIVGAYLFDNGQTNEGRAFAYHGSAEGLSLVADWTAESNQADADFGISVATAGDVNGDGFSDVIVGAMQFDNDLTDQGRAFVYHGSASGLSLAADWTEDGVGVGTGDWFGWPVATAGDVNGDGFSDVIVGALLYGLTDAGRVFVYLGSAGSLNLHPSWEAGGNQAGANFGNSVATAGDVNGDGFSDVIVGASLFDNGQTNEGQARVYQGSAYGLRGDPTWTDGSDQADARFGISVATAGDVNGDGFSDVIVGAHSFDNGQVDEGLALVYHGSASGLRLFPSWTAESDQANAHLGISVATAGDVNGDGFSDVVVGARRFDNGQNDEGRAFVYHGSAGGLSLVPNWTAESDQASAEFGYSVATAGDVNGDGFSDVAVDAPWFEDGLTDEGRAFVYHGSAGGLSLVPNWTAESDQASVEFGYSVATAGDVNGDGFSDVAVGARRFDNGQNDEGRAFVYHGPAGGLSLVPNWTAESDQVSAEFGYSVATAGDVNGDGFSDVIVGAPRFEDGLPDEGRAFVYHGSASGLSPVPNWTAESNQVLAQLGKSVATAGDVNGDGFSDVIVGAPLFEDGPTNEGRAFVYHGSAGGLDLFPSWAADGTQDGADFGISVAMAGDVNGDGFSDVIVGADRANLGGRAFVYYGNAGTGRITLLRQQRTDGATPIAPLGLSDSQTEFRIRAVMPSIYGRTRLQIEHEVKPLGTLFDALDTVTGDYLDVGDDGEVEVDQLVTALSPDTQYHWRVRAKYDLAKSPFQPHGPWVHMPLNGWNEADLRTAATPSSVDGADLTSNAALLLLSPRPNPSAGVTEMDYSLPGSVSVRLTVVDVTGRERTVLVDEMQQGGWHRVTWDGRGRDDNRLPAGVYFARLSAAGRVASRRLILTSR